MFQLLLLDGLVATYLPYFIWGLGLVLVIVAIAYLFAQRREGQVLRSELVQLSKLKKHNVEYEFVVKAMKLSTWHIDAKTRVITFDYDYREKSGEGDSMTEPATLDELIQLFVAEDVARMSKVFDDICTGRVQEFHEQYRMKTTHSQRPYWEESFATVARRDTEGLPESIVGTSMRIGQRKAMEEALVVARNRAEESDRLKSAFIANMSHEIRTPLNAIIGFTSLLPDITGDEERHQLIDLIQENNQKLLQIIDDVMNISKIEAGNDQLQMVTFDLNLTLTEVVDRFRPKANPGVTLTTEFAAASKFINSDLGRLQTILTHLLSNAVKFTQQGTITVGYESLDNKRLRIYVRDTGKGIPQELQERVFERFFKVDEFVPGAGLGLSTCRVMAFSMGGNIGLSSTPGEGSTFWLDMPEQ